MARDPRRLKPTELRRAINSTPLGAVLSERALRRHRDDAGYRIGEDRTVDLVRYAAWLAREVHRRRSKPEPGLEGYDAIREQAAQRRRALSLSGRNIGELPEIRDPKRRAACRKNFRRFCEEYFPKTFALAWSDDHLVVIAKIEGAVLEGGLFAMAMPRGSGKSTLCEVAAIWAMVYGHRGFVAIIGADEDHAESMLDSVKSELENSDELLADFPEVCYPIRCLEGIYQRASGQLFQGRPTHIGWSAKEIILPTMPGSPASGAIVRVAGITGRVRGMKFKRPDGRTVRPEFVLVDDPQTDESARSPSQCATRERVIGGALLGLGGPGVKIAGLMTLTIVREDDLADRILDREKHPQWQGERTRMVYAFPSNEKRWAQYAELLRQGLAAGDGIAAATAFYSEHRRAMDRGARVAWKARHNPDELSAIQHAMNLKIIDERAFWAEYQNAPLPEENLEAATLTADEIAAKTSGLARGNVPEWASRLTAFIDVQGKMLYWLVCAWGDDFTGQVIDYGTEPDQKEARFTLANAKRSLRAAYKGKATNPGLEAVIYAGLEGLTDRLLGASWQRDDGAAMRIERMLIDANWGSSTDTVYLFCRQSAHAAALTPSHGRGVGASAVPFSEYRRKPGERVGLNWRIPSVKGKRTVRHVVYDTNYWKTFAHERLAVGMGDPGCLSLFGRSPAVHELLAEHLTAEYPVVTQGRGRTVNEWRMRQVGIDNHWLDCLVGCAVAASMQGVSLLGESGGAERRKRKRVKLSELQRSR